MAARKPPAPGWGWRFGAVSRARFRGQRFFLQGLLAAAPWLSAVVAFGLLFAAGPRYLRQRGTVFELPAAPMDEGSLLMMPAAVLLPLEDGALLLYDDLRYHAGRPVELGRFTEALAKEVRLGRGELILLADARVPHEWVMAVAHAARKAGVDRVNIAARGGND